MLGAEHVRGAIGDTVAVALALELKEKPEETNVPVTFRGVFVMKSESFACALGAIFNVLGTASVGELLWSL